MDKIDFCYKQLNDKQELIRRTDAKASSVIVIVSFATSAFISMLFKIEVVWQRHLTGTLFCLLLGLLLFIDIVFVLMPRYKQQEPLKEENIKIIDSMTDDDLYKMLVERMILLDQILEKKNKFLKVVFILLLALAAVLFFSVFCAVF